MTEEQIMEPFREDIRKVLGAKRCRAFVNGYREGLAHLHRSNVLDKTPKEELDHKLSRFYDDVSTFLKGDGISLIAAGFGSELSYRANGNLIYIENRHVSNPNAFFEDALDGNPITSWIKHSRPTDESFELANISPMMVLNGQDPTANDNLRAQLKKESPGLPIIDNFSDLPERFSRVTLTYYPETGKAGLEIHTHPGDKNGTSEVREALAKAGFVFDRSLDDILTAKTPIGTTYVNPPLVRINSQDDLNSLFGVMGKISYREQIEKPNLEKTLSEFFSEGDVAFVLKELLDYEHSGLRRTGPSKNIVFYLTDRQGKKKIVKFSPDKQEAIKENFVNYHFSNHPVLARFLPKAELKAPIETPLETPDNKRYYLTIQENAWDKDEKTIARYRFQEEMYRSKNPKLLAAYLEKTVENLAILHHYATRLMDEYGPILRKQLGIEETEVSKYEPKANGFLTEKRLAAMGRSRAGALLQETQAKGLEYGYVWGNGDPKKENRIGSEQFIDWGNSGWLNYLKDFVKIVNDEVVLGTIAEPERDRAYMHLLVTYHRKCNELRGENIEPHKELIKMDLLALKELLIAHNSTQQVWSLEHKGRADEPFRRALKNEFSRVLGHMVKETTTDSIIYRPCYLSAHGPDGA